MSITYLVVFRMGENVLHVHALVYKLDESYNSEMVTTNIKDPPFIFMLEII